MAVYIFGQVKEYMNAGLDYGQIYRKQILREIACPVRYVYGDILDRNTIELYEKEGIEAGQILGIHQLLTGITTPCPSMKAEDKVEELKECFAGVRIEKRESEIWLVKDGYVIVSVLLDEREKSLLKGVSYFSQAKLLRMEIYTDRVAYVNYYRTAESERGLYAKLVRRSFYGGDGAVVYDQVFEGEKEWYVFPDGRRYAKQQLIAEFIETLNLSKKDMVILDTSVSNEWMRAVFTYGRAARLVAAVYAGRYFAENEREYPYYWFPYSGMIDRMIVSTEEQKEVLIKVLEEYHCTVPGMWVVPIEGGFVYAAMNESCGGKLSLSWEFTGKANGFWIYDESGKRVCETRNEHQHYFLTEGDGKESSFVVKAFVDTSIGKTAVAESRAEY